MADTRPEQNLSMQRFPEIKVALNRPADDPRAPVVLHPTRPWLGRALKEGSYGKPYLTTVDTTVFRELRTLYSAARFRQTTGNGFPALGQRIIIKLSVQKPTDPFNDWALENSREIAVHKFLQSSPKCHTLPGCSVPLCGPRVPRLYFGGMVRNNDGKQYFFTVMDLAPGIDLGDAVRRGFNAELYLKVERALCEMWGQGLVHGDTHKGNLMYDAASGRVTIIDFGFAMVLPASATAELRAGMGAAAVAGVRSMGELWRSSQRSKVGMSVQGYINRVQHSRGNPWYNPDGHSMTALYSRLSAAEMARVPALRRAMWGAQQPERVQSPRSVIRGFATSGSTGSTGTSGTSGGSISQGISGGPVPMSGLTGRGISSGPVPMSIDRRSRSRPSKRRARSAVVNAAARKLRLAGGIRKR